MLLFTVCRDDDERVERKRCWRSGICKGSMLYSVKKDKRSTIVLFFSEAS